MRLASSVQRATWARRRRMGSSSAVTHRVGRMVRVAWDGDDGDGRTGVLVVTLDRPERRNAVDHATLLGLLDAQRDGGDGARRRAHRRAAGVQRRRRPDRRRGGRVRRRARPRAARLHRAARPDDRRGRRSGARRRHAARRSPATCGWRRPASRFGIPAARLGLVVDHWTVERLARELGWPIARAMLLAAEQYDAAALHAAGAVHRLGDLDDALAWARQLATPGPADDGRRTSWRSSAPARRRRRRRRSRPPARRRGRAPTPREGRQAFLEKRPARFTGVLTGAPSRRRRRHRERERRRRRRVLSAQIRPPCWWTIEAQIASPSPVPPCWRVSEASTWWKRSKIRSSWSAGMPRPWSRDGEQDVGAVGDGGDRDRRRPVGENFTALASRLTSTCTRRSPSPSTVPSIGPVATSTPRLGRHRDDDLAGWWRSARRPGRARGRARRRPDSICSRSRMSLISRISRSRVLGGDHRHALGRRRQLADGAAGEQAERAADRGQRRAQLVADHRDELVLQPLDLGAVGHVAEHGDRRQVGVDDGRDRQVDGERSCRPRARPARRPARCAGGR